MLRAKPAVRKPRLWVLGAIAIVGLVGLPSLPPFRSAAVCPPLPLPTVPACPPPAPVVPAPACPPPVPFVPVPACPPPAPVVPAPACPPAAQIERTPASAPVVISVESGHFFSDYERVVPCDVPCEFKRGVPGADARWYHLCGGDPKREFPEQAQILMSMESSVNYPCLADPAYLSMFDIRATYRITSHVPIIYLMPEHINLFNKTTPEQENKIVFLQGNCGSKTNREGVVSRLIELSQNRSWKIEARGACLNNAAPFPRGRDKKEELRNYKFAFTFENSEDAHYITEKVWDGLAAGNIPIYFGAPEIERYVPHPLAFINYRILETPERLADYLDAVTSNETLWKEHHAWRQMPLSELNKGFQQMVKMAQGPHTQCLMCKQVAAYKASHGL